MRGGWGLDLATHDTDGLPWGFNGVRVRHRAVRKVVDDKPLIFIGGLACTTHSAMNRIKYSKMRIEEVERKVAHARKHLEFCIKLYEVQWRNGR